MALSSNFVVCLLAGIPYRVIESASLVFFIGCQQWLIVLVIMPLSGAGHYYHYDIFIIQLLCLNSICDTVKLLENKSFFSSLAFKLARQNWNSQLAPISRLPLRQCPMDYQVSPLCVWQCEVFPSLCGCGCENCSTES